MLQGCTSHCTLYNTEIVRQSVEMELNLECDIHFSDLYLNGVQRTMVSDIPEMVRILNKRYISSKINQYCLKLVLITSFKVNRLGTCPLIPLNPCKRLLTKGNSLHCKNLILLKVLGIPYGFLLYAVVGPTFYQQLHLIQGIKIRINQSSRIRVANSTHTSKYRNSYPMRNEKYVIQTLFL